LATSGAEQFIENDKIANSNYGFAEPRPDVCRQQSLAICDRVLCSRQFPIRDGDTTLPAKQIERPLHTEHHLIVRAGRLLTELGRYRRILPEASLKPHSTRDVDGRSCRAQRWLLCKRSCDSLIERKTSDRVDERFRRLGRRFRAGEYRRRDEESRHHSKLHWTLP
jgi:hypothetical protein